jgi:hypothetical protein
VRELFRGELPRRPTALLIAEDVDYRDLQLVVGDLVSRHHGELALGGGEPGAPARHSLDVDAQVAGQRRVGLSFGYPEHYLDAFRQPSLQGSGPAQPLQYRSLSRQQPDSGGVSTHGPIMIP